MGKDLLRQDSVMVMIRGQLGCATKINGPNTGT